ncbi:MAG TPA: hypothetical protein VHY22_12830 [Chthoniobacteraceae bacterium]|nr:hypothetical protein [Chthoniobacteraceae bacterium]
MQNIGISTKKPYGPPAISSEYALAVSLIFTKATNQCIILGTEPRHVLSTSILWNSLLHDSRFKQVSLSQALPGDIIIQSGWHQATGFTGVVVDHGRIVSNSSRGVQNNSSLAEIQRAYPAMAVFRYIGVQRFANCYLANGYNPDEARIPAGQPGGGQWTTGSVGEFRKAPLKDGPAERMMQIDPPIASNPISEALDLLGLASIPSLFKSIPSLVAVSAKELGVLLRKLAAVAAGQAVKFTDEESGLLAKILSRFKEAPESLTPAEKTVGLNEPPPSANFKAVKYVPEAPTAMSENAAAYQEGAPGSRYGMAPKLSTVGPNGEITAKFDGVDAATGEMVDRKLNIGGSSVNLARRQSATATANGFGVRWEVPNSSVQAAAQTMISRLGIKNIRVIVRPK